MKNLHGSASYKDGAGGPWMALDKEELGVAWCKASKLEENGCEDPRKDEAFIEQVLQYLHGKKNVEWMTYFISENLI